MSKQTETCHFWLGSFPDKDFANEYFKEIYNNEDEDREYTPLSKFAASQGETWYDHDFMECGFNAEASSVMELVAHHSYSDQYDKELQIRSDELKLKNINFLVFITDREISKPVSVIVESFSLHYVGTISYEI